MLENSCQKLELEGDTICPFSSYMSPFGEAVEFDSSKSVCLIIDAFGVLDVGKDRAINLTASIDAAKLTKNISHTSAGVKMTDPGGLGPGGVQRYDMQSYCTIFLLKIILTRETKDSFKLFEDVFHFFRLAGLSSTEREANERNEEKFKWEALEDLKPLNITSATDMVADWKIVGVGGGCKTTELFCMLCACRSSQVHQPNTELCQRFCFDKMDDPQWRCFHHPVASSTCAKEVRKEITTLQASLRADLDVIERSSRIIYAANPNAISRTTDSLSIFFTPRTDDDKDEFIDLLFAELMLRGLALDDDLEELRQSLLSALVLEGNIEITYKS
jgi:hypothetical protein